MNPGLRLVRERGRYLSRISQVDCVHNCSMNFWSLGEMVRSVRERKILPLELLDAHLTQIQKEGPRPNSFVDVYEKRPRSAAKQATESRVLNGESPPLHGIPLTI